MGYNFPNAPNIGQIAHGFVWDGAAWIVSASSSSTLDFLTKTTPIAAIGSDIEQPIPNWLAGAPIIDVIDDCVIEPRHRGAWVHMLNDVGSVILLPDDWAPGMAFGARQIGFGPVVWQVAGGASMQLPFTKAAHVGISEQFEEVIFRVITNVGGHAAAWGVSGGTS